MSNEQYDDDCDYGLLPPLQSAVDAGPFIPRSRIGGIPCTMVDRIVPAATPETLQDFVD